MENRKFNQEVIIRASIASLALTVLCYLIDSKNQGKEYTDVMVQQEKIVDSEVTTSTINSDKAIEVRRRELANDYFKNRAIIDAINNGQSISDIEAMRKRRETSKTNKN